MTDSTDRAVAGPGRVRLLLRRYVISQAGWLPPLADAMAADHMVGYLMTGNPPESEALSELTRQLSGPEQPESWDSETVQNAVEELSLGLRLSPIETDLLWVLLAPELDEHLRAIYGMLWGDRRRRHCELQFVLCLLDTEAPARARAAIDWDGPLFALGLVEQLVGAGNEVLLRLADRVVEQVIGVERVPATIAPWVEVHAGELEAPWEKIEVYSELQQAIRDDRGRHAVFVIEGSASDLALPLRQLLAHGPQPLLVFKIPRLDSDLAKHPLLREQAAALRAVFREARLRRAAVAVLDVDHLEEAPEPTISTFVKLVAEEPGPVFLCANPALPAALTSKLLSTVTPLYVPADAPTADARRAVWNQLLSEHDVPTDQLDGLAARPLSPCAMATITSLFEQRRGDLASLADGFREGSLGNLAVPVRASLSWGDIVLPDAIAERIEEIRAFGRHHDLLMDEWGLGRIASGRGIKILLSGPSGTGKTLISGLLARDLGRELYRVDIPSIVSKYIGETEQHLSELFAAAESGGCGLLFDEADSLFGRRTDVKSSVDRYANQGVNYLLQRVEEYEGLIILTTNLERSIDSAFVRRLHYHVRFDAPGADERRKLWEIHLPPELPLGEDLDLDRVAQTYELTGGQIRRAVIRAAVYALSGERRVGLAEIVRSAEAEYAELGKLPPAPPSKKQG